LTKPSRGRAQVTDGTDNDLAKRAAAGERAAFAALVERHYDRIYRLAWRWSGARSHAEDIAQDVVVKLATAIKTFRGESEFSTWLYRVAYATAVDSIRSRQRIVSLSPSNMLALTESATDQTPEDNVLGQELWAAVRALPGQQRDAVLLVYGEDLTHQEAAAIMGCTEKTVSWHLHEARKRLRGQLEAVG
jgi:RNA polymerase sigma-70 factor (ECF subfamily)